MTGAAELPDSMPAAVYRQPGTVSLEEYPVPSLGADEVLIEVSHCGICGSDLHMVLEGWSAPDIVHGHEFSGRDRRRGNRRAAVGGRAPRWWAVRRRGAAAVPPAGPACRRSASSDGEIMSDTQGAFARYIAVDQRSLLAVPEGMSLRAAALAEPLAVSLHGITRSGIVPGERALVLGAGPIGALTVAALVARGFTDVAVAEPGPARQELARRLGAEPGASDPTSFRRSTSAEPDRLAPDAYHVVFECSGKRAAMESGLSQLRRGGRLVLVGAGIEPPRFDPNRILLNELTITGSFVYDADGFQVALDLLASGRSPIDVLVEPDDVPLDGLLDAMRALASGRTGRQGDGGAPPAEGASMTDLFPSRTPRFNHVAMSLPPDQLDDDGRKAIVEFYGEVFGWQELPMLTEDRKRLVLSAHTYEQFVFLVSEDDPMQSPASRPLRDVGRRPPRARRRASERAKDFAERDPRVDLIDPEIDDHEVVKIHSFYVGYLLPMMVEVQYWEFADSTGFGSTRQ